MAAICVLLAVSIPRAAADEIDLDTTPLLQPEHCFKTSPDEVLTQLTHAGWFDCQTCIDSALLLYAERVRPLVDARLAKVAAARAPLTEALISFDRAFQSVSDGNWFGHETSRHGAAVEWMLIQLGTGKNAYDDPHYGHDDLRAIMLMWYRARRIPDGPEPQPTEAQFLARVDGALASLTQAEGKLSPDQAAHLRCLMMIRIARWL